MLAIAAPSFNAISETFIRDHVRTVYPGKTVLICRDADGSEGLDCTTLKCQTLSPTKSLRRRPRIVSALAWRWNLLTYMLDPEDENAVAAYLNENNVKALLVEYLTVGVGLERASARAGVPIYLHAHGSDVSLLANWAVWRVRYRRLFRSAAGVIAPSRYLAAKLKALGCPEDKLHVCSCGVDPSRFQPSRRAPLRILAVGRFVEKKGPLQTINAFARVRKQFPESRLDMIGDGPLMADCVNLRSELQLDDCLKFHGAQPHDTVQQMMGQASIFVQHSVTAETGETEGLPVAILEAMASALPVVSTRHSGIPEAVIDGETGLLVDEHDIAGTAAAVRSLLGDPERAMKMGLSGRNRVLDNYTHAHTCERLRNIMNIWGDK